MKHLQDNTKPFGLLSEEEQEYLRGLDIGDIEIFTVQGWAGVLNKPLWKDVAYRVKPKPLTKPSIDWSHVHEDYNWLATDKDGATSLFTDKPKVDTDLGEFWFGGFSCHVTPFTSFREGACDWADSLVQRPDYNT